MLHTNDPNALMYPEYSPYNLQPGRIHFWRPATVWNRVGNCLQSAVPAELSRVQQSESNAGERATQRPAVHSFLGFRCPGGRYRNDFDERDFGDLNLFLVLIDGNNNLLAYDDDGAGDKNAELGHLVFRKAEPIPSRRHATHRRRVTPVALTN